MQLIMVHGWSVTHTNTYGKLPQSIALLAQKSNLKIDINHIHLGKYISFNDQVTMDDVASALNHALHELSGNTKKIAPFSCITHSTGGPVVRYWLDKYYSRKNAANNPLKHLMMLAPANQGSALAALGKKQVSRIKSWFTGVEPGLKILDWLCLGSDGQNQLNQNSLNHSYLDQGCYPFVFTGQGIDTKLYDFINNYLVEDGSDGVIRIASANMNYRSIRLVQSQNKTPGKFSKTFLLESKTKKLIYKPAKVALAVFSNLSHSGKKMGIMASRQKYSHHQKLAQKIINCLKVNNETSYEKSYQQLEQFTNEQQRLTPVGKKNPINRFCMMVFNIHDQNGDNLDEDDFDILLTAGSNYSANELPSGFFKDRQLNPHTNHLVFYLNYDRMLQIKEQLLGIRVIARPTSGFCYFHPVEFRDTTIKVEQILAANTTTYIDIELKREVDKNVFRFISAKQDRESFKRVKPSGENVS